VTSRRAAELIAVILAALVGIFAPAAAEAVAVQMLGTTATKAAPYTYDGLTISRVDVYAPDGAAGAPPLSDVREGSPSAAASAARASTTPSSTAVATEAADTTRVGRWMSEGEFDTMSSTGRVVEGSGGRTYVVEPPNPNAYRATGPGSVYAEFDVPTSSLRPAGDPAHAVIPGPNVTTRLYGPSPPEMPTASCIVLVCRK
jgi:hypothetical protein